MPFEQFDCLGNLFFIGQLRVRKDDAAGVFHLVVEKFAKVFHIQFALAGIHHGGKTVEHSTIRGGVLHGANNIRKFTNAGGLDEDAVGGVFRKHFLERFAEIANQGAANATAVHLVDNNACILQKSAVNADLPKLVLNKNNLFSGVCLFEQFFNKCGLSGAQKARKNIDFGHKNPFFFQKFSAFYYSILF